MFAVEVIKLGNLGTALHLRYVVWKTKNCEEDFDNALPGGEVHKVFAAEFCLSTVGTS